MTEPEKCPQPNHRGWIGKCPDCAMDPMTEEEWAASGTKHDPAPAAEPVRSRHESEVCPICQKRKAAEGETNDARTIQGSSQPAVGNLRDAATDLCGERILPRIEAVAPAGRSAAEFYDSSGTFFFCVDEQTMAAIFRFAEAYAQPLRDEIQRLQECLDEAKELSRFRLTAIHDLQREIQRLTAEISQFNQVLNQALKAMEDALERTEKAEAERTEMRDSLWEAMGELATLKKGQK